MRFCRHTVKWKIVITSFVISFLLISNAVSNAASKSGAKPGSRNAANANANEKLPETFKVQAMKFVDEGSVISSITETGVNYTEMRKLYVQAKGTYGLLDAVWPKEKLEDVKQLFEKALSAWELALYLWRLKINDSDRPTEPSGNRYLEFVAFSKSCHPDNILEFKVHPDNFIVPEEYRGKKYIPFDGGNISQLLSVGALQFGNGRTIFLNKLQQSESK